MKLHIKHVACSSLLLQRTQMRGDCRIYSRDRGSGFWPGGTGCVRMRPSFTAVSQSLRTAVNTRGGSSKRHKSPAQRRGSCHFGVEKLAKRISRRRPRTRIGRAPARRAAPAARRSSRSYATFCKRYSKPAPGRYQLNALQAKTTNHRLTRHPPPPQRRISNPPSQIPTHK